jgi:DNA-directed RNA polymerase subunit E'/Rpb7
MFVLVLISDILRIPPSDFDLQEVDALKFQINKKFANKVTKIFVFALSSSLFFLCFVIA